jgi:hypothetical protein
MFTLYIVYAALIFFVWATRASRVPLQKLVAAPAVPTISNTFSGHRNRHHIRLVVDKYAGKLFC